jgi:hypothetical protein
MAIRGDDRLKNKQRACHERFELLGSIARVSRARTDAEKGRIEAVGVRDEASLAHRAKVERIELPAAVFRKP